ncbi:MAG TPA: hypothetical protein VHY82_16050 [Acetobacteraceae bacterium]|nr:hypothetical protein [Acetobacteraceae bacterium]
MDYLDAHPEEREALQRGRAARMVHGGQEFETLLARAAMESVVGSGQPSAMAALVERVAAMTHHERVCLKVALEHADASDRLAKEGSVSFTVPAC